MRCAYHEAGRCRSCTLLQVPYPEQVRTTDQATREALRAHVPASAWLEPVLSASSHFRNKAKLAVGGTTASPTFGIVDGAGHGVDLRECPLYEPGLHEAVLTVARLVPKIGLQPYDVARRQGELKHLLMTHSPTGELMIRFVLRSTNQLGRLGRGLATLREALPTARVVSANLQPAHAAILEGDDEEVLTEESTLAMPIADVTLHLGTRSFFQTNTAVAEALYREAGRWAAEARPHRLWDLYCGVGGFALHAAHRLRAEGLDTEVLGIEASAEAISGARRAAAEQGLAAARFVSGDATSLALHEDSRPDLVVVNPPRRGVGPELATWLDGSPATTMIYSSCNPATLARDLAHLPSWRVTQARSFDMFPQTRHTEVLVRLERG